MVNLNQKCNKYIVLGRKLVIKNLNGEDITKLISEVYGLVPNTIDTGISEYRRLYYKEIVGGRGVDLSDMDSGETYMTIDRTAGDFFELNFTGFPELETNTLLKFKTFKNKNFIKRKRETTFHEEYDVVMDKNGKTKAKKK